MTDQSQSLLIINPAAGKGKGDKGVEDILKRLGDRFGKMDTFVSRYPGHLLRIGEEVKLEQYKRIFTLGGDGTTFELINGIQLCGGSLESLELGMIPAGTGNSFLRDFITVNRENAINAIVEGSSRPVDVGEFVYFQDDQKEKRHFINILGVGLIADILKLTNERLKPFGALGYSMAVLLRLFKGMNNRIVVTVDDKEWAFTNSALAISNSKFTGGEMKMAPMAETDDGMLDIIVFNEVNRREILSIFSKIFSGKHISHPKVTILRGRKIHIDAQPQQLLMADGELLGSTPLELHVSTRKLNLRI